MKEENYDDEEEAGEYPSDVDTNDDQSWMRTLKTPSIPFANFYITKPTLSNSSGSQYKLSEHLTNISITNGDETVFELDLMDIPSHKPRLKRCQVYRNVRVSHVDEHLSSVYIFAS